MPLSTKIEILHHFKNFLQFEYDSIHGITIYYWKNVFILVILILFLFLNHQIRQRTQFQDWNFLATSFSMSFWAGIVLLRLCLFANIGRRYWHHPLLWGTRKSHYIVPKAALFTQMIKNVQIIFSSGQKIDFYPKNMLGQHFVLPSSLRSVKSV